MDKVEKSYNFRSYDFGITYQLFSKILKSSKKLKKRKIKKIFMSKKILLWSPGSIGLIF